MKSLLVLGAGKIGTLIAILLANHGTYKVYLADQNEDALSKQIIKSNVKTKLLNASEPDSVAKFLKKHPVEAVLSALPFYCNAAIARLAAEFHIHYFDLTEDVEVTREIIRIAQDSDKVFSPQGGLAPGFISIVTQDLINRFDSMDSVKMRVGALPLNPNNALKYSLTWSTDGLINEYGNPCVAIIDRQLKETQPLDGLETIEMDGLLYEAFNTSGGIGTLAENCLGRVNFMDYKTLRYPGHCEKIRFLMNDLKLNHDRDNLKRILERAVPKTKQDVVLIYASVMGWVKDELFEETYFKKIYPQKIHDKLWSAIQITTASSACCIIDLVMEKPDQYQGFIPQERFDLNQFLKNPFGKYYR